MRRPGQALSRLQFIESAWDIGYESRSNLVDVYVRYLRKKIDRPFGRHALETVRASATGCARTGDDAPADPVRLTLAFTLVMAVVLAAMSFFVYARVGSTLLASIDQSLRGQTVDVSRLDRGRLDLDSAAAEAIAQVRPSAGAHRSRPTRRAYPVCSGARPWRGVAGGERSVRAAAGPEGALARAGRADHRPRPHGGARCRELVRGPRRDARPSARRAADRRAAGALLAAVAGYGLAAAALRPVEAMRARAEAISASTPGARLPVPPARDEISRLAETLNEMLARLEAAFAHERRFVARRQPRAADSARAAEDRARAGAAPAAHARTSSSRRSARPRRKPTG